VNAFLGTGSPHESPGFQRPPDVLGQSSEPNTLTFPTLLHTKDKSCSAHYIISRLGRSCAHKYCRISSEKFFVFSSLSRRHSTVNARESMPQQRLDWANNCEIMERMRTRLQQVSTYSSLPAPHRPHRRHSPKRNDTLTPAASQDLNFECARSFSLPVDGVVFNAPG